MNSHTIHPSPQKRIAPSSDSQGSRKRLATGGGVTYEAQEELAPARLRPRKSSMPSLSHLFNRTAVKSSRISECCPSSHRRRSGGIAHYRLGSVEEGDEVSERMW